MLGDVDFNDSHQLWFATSPLKKNGSDRTEEKKQDSNDSSPTYDKAAMNAKPKQNNTKKLINKTLFVSIKVKRLSDVDNVNQTVEHMYNHLISFHDNHTKNPCTK